MSLSFGELDHHAGQKGHLDRIIASKGTVSHELCLCSLNQCVSVYIPVLVVVCKLSLPCQQPSRLCCHGCCWHSVQRADRVCVQDVFDMFLWSGCVCLALMAGRRLHFYLQHTKWPLCETGKHSVLWYIDLTSRSNISVSLVTCCPAAGSLSFKSCHSIMPASVSLSLQFAIYYQSFTF